MGFFVLVRFCDNSWVKKLLKSKYGCLFFDYWNKVIWVVFLKKLFDKWKSLAKKYES